MRGFVDDIVIAPTEARRVRRRPRAPPFGARPSVCAGPRAGRPGCVRPRGRPTNQALDLPDRVRPARVDSLRDTGGIDADQLIGAVRDRHRPLRVLPKRQARNAQRRRLFLDAARIGEHEARVVHQREKVEIAFRPGR